MLLNEHTKINYTLLIQFKFCNGENVLLQVWISGLSPNHVDYKI